MRDDEEIKDLIKEWLDWNWKCYFTLAYLTCWLWERYTLKLEFQNVVIIGNSVEICDFVLTEKSYLLDNQLTN
jgi:hypothetical protein